MCRRETENGSSGFGLLVLAVDGLEALAPVVHGVAGHRHWGSHGEGRAPHTELAICRVIGAAAAAAVS